MIYFSREKAVISAKHSQQNNEWIAAVQPWGASSISPSASDDPCTV